MNDKELCESLRLATDKGHHTIKCCSTCGFCAWRETRVTEPFGVTFDPYRDCRRCAEVFARSPELASWVIAVVATSRMAP